MHIRPAICSHSLGRAWVHSLPQKFDQAAKFGLDIELFDEDLLYVAKELPGGDTPDNRLEAARIIRRLADERGITIMCLQPFMHYEGLRDRQEHQARIAEMKLFIQMAKILGTSLISIPSTWKSEVEMSGDMDLIVSDLQEVADLGAREGIQYAYESLCWGTWSFTWEASWEIVKRVDRPNFGICLDTFNMAGRMYADPTSQTGKTANAEAETKASLERLVQTVDVAKIAYVQVVDAEYLQDPLIEGHQFYDPAQPAHMSWSRNCRLFYGEHDRGAYLPIHTILKAILVQMSFEGWVSAELFNRSLADPASSVPEEHARRAAISWGRILHDFTDAPVKSSVLDGFTEQVARAQL